MDYLINKESNATKTDNTYTSGAFGLIGDMGRMASQIIAGELIGQGRYRRGGGL